jgi:ribosomal protein S18 acetylase RimI-like enzyme
MMNDPDSVILTCRQEHQLIGCVFLQKQKSKMYLGMLTVDPELQDKGLGKLLLKKAEEHAVDKGCDTIMITVITKRLELIDWYKRRGYTETGEVKPFPDDPKFGLPKEPLSFCVMEKQIDML